ncbi:MAG: primosomal protein N' [Verrucomicrobia bacterium]|nr:primosomal protein N' [Verrucomicrobiota bacterium]MCG2680644.1 primosomal protein N' [Kiritimatiellia bacterium]MBU4247432.1 primosomal protein N' [Verrucomicrobiota bacterium]MBU4291490.1 primosomal protein N' [Verrucomicrobiota bacterium]MBU4429673.1 primosomal protein N' [Verrucomicrobiota bacterium]
MQKIAKVVVEIALDREFDYRIPEALAAQVRIGSRVRIPFGHSMTRGYVVGLADHSDRHDLKALDSLVSPKPLLDETMLKLARWIGDYYAATIEQAIRTVLPCAVRRHGARFREQRDVCATELARDAALLEKLRPKNPGQASALDHLLSHGTMAVPELVAAAGVSASVIKSLEKKKLVLISLGTRRRDPLAAQIILPTQPLTLFPEQAEALAMVKQSIDTLKPSAILLHGVTGSGKTEVYLQAIRYVLDKGQGAIVLVPEISLTPQTVERFRGRFGDAIAVLHSHLSDGERHDEWYRIYESKARIVIGARSALFAPVEKLGLIVVDEEHEPSYKQADVPRYHARDVAVMRGQMEGCAVLLGSASPALESFYNVRRGKYGLAVLTHRVDHRQMPVMRIIDMRVEAEREGHVNILSRELAEAIKSRLDRAEQTMLFLNRRGFATTVICPACGFVATCDQCSIKLTYHKNGENLRCHMCGRTAKVPARCPACGDRTIKFTGIGTQRIEAIVKTFFPKARVQRMDADTTSRKLAFHEILGAFKARKIDILIGTQMIAKGLHFPGVTLVGVIYADLSLHMPDFRSAERTFQLLLQVAGRAGRGDVPGEVIVQTFNPMHPAIQAARRLDYQGFMDQELESRRELVYPPFSHLVCVTLEGPSEETVAMTGRMMVKQLQPKLTPAVKLAGPIPAPFSRIKGQFRYQVILRSPSVKAMSRPLKETLCELKRPAKVRLAVDVDALSMM